MDSHRLRQDYTRFVPRKRGGDPGEIDHELQTRLTPTEYDRIKKVISAGVVNRYRKEMLPVCRALTDNALNFRIPSTPQHKKRITNQLSEWTYERKDPKLLTDEELINEVTCLENFLQAKWKENQRLRRDISLLGPAVRQLDFDKQCLVGNLFNLEQSLIKPRRISLTSTRYQKASGRSFSSIPRSLLETPRKGGGDSKSETSEGFDE